MAKSDYRCCDICDSKVFYDANLNYECTPEAPYFKLDYLGDWKVICDDCSKTHEVIIVEKPLPLENAQ